MQGTEKQRLALRRLADNKTKVIVYGGAAGGGKSFLGAFWIILAGNSYPNTRWFIGREELKRIRQSTLITWEKVCKSVGFSDYSFNFQDNYILFGNGTRVDLLDLKYEPRDPLYERFGSLEYTGGWIEEAGEINLGAYDVLRGRVGRHLNDVYGITSKMLVTCNPKKGWLYTNFFRPYKENRLADDHVFIPALVQDNPHLTPDYIDNLKSTIDRVKRERLLFGNWDYEDSADQLISYDAIRDYFNGSHLIAQESDKKYITADIARKGRDKTIVRVWSGWVCIERREMKVSKVTESADLIKSLALKHSIPNSRICIDEDGVGGGCVDMVSSEGFVNNSRPLNGENFTNLKSQCSFMMAKMIMDRKCMEICSSTEVMEAVKQEMEQVKQANIDSDGKVAILGKDEMKEKLGRSPDEWDSIMMRYYFELSTHEFYFG